MFCVGATKAGTSSLYAYLHDHPEFYMRSIKEIHYFDTIDFNDFERQFDVLARLRSSLIDRQNVARENENAWKVGNLQRQIDDVDELVSVLETADESGSEYLKYMFKDMGDKKAAGDITPGYALLSEERLKHMARLAEDVRFVFLMRDPVERLWSHVRMQATRQSQEDIEFHVKARRIMNRTVNKDMETHITQRGRYKEIVEKLKRAVPEDKLFVGFTEDSFTQEGQNALCDFLGLSHFTKEKTLHAHQGVKLKLNDRQRSEAARFLAPEYDYVEKTFGPLPERWQANMARM